jgi:hypothetical protein
VRGPEQHKTPLSTPLAGFRDHGASHFENIPGWRWRESNPRLIVDDHHALAAILAAEARRTGAASPIYLDARVPAMMHLRLVSALYKPRSGPLTQLLQTAAPDAVQRAALLEHIAVPGRGSVEVLDDRPVAAAIGALTAERGVSIAFGALIAHAQAAGQPILIDPSNRGRWIEVASARKVEVVALPAGVQ